MGVVVRGYIDFLIFFIPIYSTYISSFLQQHPYFFVHFLFFSFLFVIFVQYTERCSKNIQDGSKIKITPTWQNNYINKHVNYESQDFQVHGTE